MRIAPDSPAPICSDLSISYAQQSPVLQSVDQIWKPTCVYSFASVLKYLEHKEV